MKINPDWNTVWFHLDEAPPLEYWQVYNRFIREATRPANVEPTYNVPIDMYARFVILGLLRTWRKVVV